MITLEPGERFKMICGDAFDVLPELGEVDAVITDPPYAVSHYNTSNVKSVHPDLKSLKYLKHNRPLSSDWSNHSFFFERIIAHGMEKTPDTGAVWLFGNWKSAPAYAKAANDAGFRVTSQVIWDKGVLMPGPPQALRNCYEVATLIAGPAFRFKDRGQTGRDIQRFPWAKKPNGHPSEKPQALLRWLIENSVPEDGIVVDPFCGSGTTGAAAMECGRRFIGVELDPYWAEYSAQRIQAELDKQNQKED